MDTVGFGRGIRALRVRARLTQDELSDRAKVSRGVVARIEQGHADRVTVATLERVAAALGARVWCRMSWHGEGLDRLLDADHARTVEHVLRHLRAEGWLVAAEVSFSVFGERGSIDVLAFHPASRVVLVVEVKSVVPDVQATLVTLDRKERLALEIARARGWDGVAVSRLLVVRDGRTAREDRRPRNHVRHDVSRSDCPHPGLAQGTRCAAADPRPVVPAKRIPGGRYAAGSAAAPTR